MKQAAQPIATPIGRRSHDQPKAAFQISSGIAGLPVESPLDIEINGVPQATLLCTPESLEELVVGWCFGQGFIDSIADLSRVRFKGSRATIMLNRSLPGGHDWREQLTAGFDAGLIRSPHSRTVTPPPRDGFIVSGSEVMHTVEVLFDRFRQSNAAPGIHFAGVRDLRGTSEMAFHDFSRHNAVDKLIGWSVLTMLALDQSMLVLTGRISGSIVYKALRAGIKIVASRALPSAQAIRLAQGGGMTLVGRALDPERTIYTHPWRIDRTG